MQSTETLTSKSSLISHSIRKMVLEIVHKGNASHCGTSLSAIEILTAVFRSVDIEKIRQKSNARDRVILSKGHAAATLYSTLTYFGLMDKKDLSTYYANDSLLSGHSSHFIPYVEHSTGSLGHGLPVSVGICLGMKSRNISARTFVIVGDGELNEGSNWEALMLAGHHQLNNLCVLVDNNNLGGVEKTTDVCTLEPLKAKFESFQFETYEIDGHDEELIYSIIQKTQSSKKPIGIICKTTKGKGVSFMEHNNVWHYRPPNKEAYEQALAELEKDK